MRIYMCKALGWWDCHKFLSHIKISRIAIAIQIERRVYHAVEI